MTRLRQAIDAAVAALTKVGVGSPRADAELLAAHAAGVDRGKLSLVEPGPDFFERYGALVAQRIERKPLQHIVGTAAFGTVIVHVGPGVFIPRPETEAMLEWAVAQPLSQHPRDRRSVHRYRCAGVRAVEELAGRARHRR